jgi:LPS-assembly protein
MPIPIYLPFGIYPMYNGRHSGLMAPTFTTTQQYGIALQNLGYYKVFNDVWDVATRTTLYSYGGWTLDVSPRYFKRYRYNGNFTIDVQHTKLNFKGDPDYNVTNSFKVRWSHNTDSKSRPGVTFGASVEAGSSKFNQNVIGAPNTNFRNQLTSSINYSKRWLDKPFTLSATANHSQNSVTGSYDVQLPNLNFNVATLYPFRRKEAVGSLKWYENIGIALNTQATNKTTFNDTDSITKVRPVGKQITDNLQWGARHSVPISLSLPPLGPVQVAPGVSYSETWYQQKSIIGWNDSLGKTDTSVRKGFYTARDMGFSLGMSSRIFGMFTFGKKSSIKAIRHEIRPTLSINYKPDMNKRSYYTTQIDTTGKTADYSYYAINNVNSPYGQGRFAGLSFGVDNNLQMKVKDKKDTSADATKKVTLLDGFSINGSYNFLAPKFKLSNFSLSARSNLFNKINISASATIDPYLYDSLGNDIDRLVWKEKTFTLGRITGGNVSLSTSFQGGEKENKQSNDQLRRGVNPITGLPLTENQEEAAYITNNAAEYTDFSIPWSVQIGYALTFSQQFNKIPQRFKTKFSSNVNISGSLALTKKWQLGVSSYYNFSSGSVGMISLSIAREMHCWQMSISVSPVGQQKFFSINISPKSALLRDIKVNRSKYFYD